MNITFMDMRLFSLLPGELSCASVGCRASIVSIFISGWSCCT